MTDWMKGGIKNASAWCYKNKWKEKINFDSKNLGHFSEDM